MYVNGDSEMSYQSAAFRRTVAERMEAYRDRIAARIKAEMDRRGEDPRDLGYAIGVRDRTIERWLAKESEPRTRNLKALAEHWELELSELRPDLEEEERRLQAQLDRMESKLDMLLEHADITVPEPLAGPGPGPLLFGAEGDTTSPKAGGPKAGHRSGQKPTP